MRPDTITAVGPDYVREGNLLVNFAEDALPTPVLAQNAIAAYRLRKDAETLMRVSEEKGRFIGRIEGVVWSLLGVIGAMAILWLGGAW